MNAGPHRTLLRQAAGFAAWLAIVGVAAGLGALASIDAASFYAQLAKPSWAPPASVFGPVWSGLYLLMAIAAWLVWRDASGRARTTALALFLAQLAVNALWSWLFFGWRLGALAFADVVLLVVLLAATVAAFWRLRRVGAALLLPSLAWVCFATALTWAVWQRNPALL